MQVTRFLIHDRFIHCNTLSAKHFNEEEFFISRGMLFQMTGPEYERLSLKILRLGLGVTKFSSETDLMVASHQRKTTKTLLRPEKIAGRSKNAV